MRKKILGMIVALNAIIAVAQARFYVGINANHGAQTMKDLQESNRTISIHPTDVIVDSFRGNQKGYGLDVVLGAEDFYSRYFGTRYGLGVGYALLGESKMINAEFSFDLLLDFFNNRNFGIGIFGGAGVNYHYRLAQKHIFLNLDGRIGISTLIRANHRIEAFFKLPVASVKLNSKSPLFAKTTLSVGYKIIF